MGKNVAFEKEHGAHGRKSDPKEIVKLVNRVNWVRGTHGVVSL